METRPFINTTERLAEVVAEARHENGWTQAELARRAGVGRQFISDLEGNHPRAEIGKVLAVLQTLGLSPRAVPVRPDYEFDADGQLREQFRG